VSGSFPLSASDLIFRNPILSVEILNLPEVLANFTSPEPVINLTMRLDSRGHLATANAVVVSNATEDESTGGVAGKWKGLFGKKDKEDKATDEDEAEEAEKDVKEKDKKKPKAEKLALRFKEHHLGVKATTGEEKRKIMSR
jgi:hypoxia up-regulated 1